VGGVRESGSPAHLRLADQRRAASLNQAPRYSAVTFDESCTPVVDIWFIDLTNRRHKCRKNSTTCGNNHAGTA